MADCPDLWGVHDRLEALRATALLPRFAAWREDLIRRVAQGMEGDAEADAPAGKGHRDASAALEAAFAHLLTGDERHARHAARLLDAVRADSEPWDRVDHNEMYPRDRADLVTAETAKACASAVSWLWPVVSDEQRRAWVEMIAQRGGRPIYESALAGSWWANALNSNWTAVLNSGLGFAALALKPFDPETAGRWLAFARARIVEMLDLAQEEAAGVEGPGYWLYCFGSALDLVEALRNVHGDDLYGHPFWRSASRFLPYFALPDFSAWVNYADTAYRGLSGSAFLHALATRVRDPLAQGFGNAILDRHGGAGWKNVLFYDADLPERTVEGEPPSRLFGSIHLASLRSGWDPDAVFMLFKGGSNAWSHTHLDLNSFFIVAHGERLATEPGPEDYSLAYWHSIQPPVSTAWHNCIVVDGAHQRVPAQYAMSLDLEESGDCYSRFGDWLSCDELVMVRGDASTAYGDSLQRAWRDVVYLPPDVFIIHDDLLAHPVRTQRNFEWLLHSECPLVEVEGGLEARGERARLLIQPVFPSDWEHKLIPGRTIPKADGKALRCVSIRPYWHHKWNVNPDRSPYPHWDPRGDAEPLHGRDCRYLVVLSALRTGVEPRFRVEGFAQGEARGVRLQGDDETVVVVFNHGGGAVSVAGIETDAEKAVVRAGRERVAWAVVRGVSLKWEGRPLFAGQAPTSRVGHAPA